MAPTSRRICLWIPGAKPMLTRAQATMVPLILFLTVLMEPPAVKGIIVILRAGSDNQAFSLLELLLVLLLLGLSSLIVLPPSIIVFAERQSVTFLRFFHA